MFYHDYGKGGIRMPNLNLILRLTWLPRLLNPAKQNSKSSISDHFVHKGGGLDFCKDATTT